MPLCTRPCRYCGNAMLKVAPGTRYCSLNCYFDFNVKKTDQCWLWTGVCTSHGYGKMTRGRGNVILAHRFSLERAKGISIPKIVLVLHQCDNPPCVNPEHLFCGSHKDNTADMLQKGRNGKGYSTGSKNPAAKINEKIARRIKRDVHVPAKYFAKHFGLHRNTIGKIRRGQIWSHVI